MTYEEFKTEFIEALEQDIVALDDINYKIDTIDAPFGKSDRLIVGREGSSISMAFKLENMYKDLEVGHMDFMDVEKSVVNTILNNYDSLAEKEKAVKDMVFDFDKVKDNLLLRMIPGDSPVVDECPHKNIGDMALVVQMVIEEFAEPDSRSTAIIRNEMLDVMGVDEDTLFETAKANAPEKDGITVKTMIEAITGMIPEEMLEEVPAEKMLYVVSTESGIHGAAVMAYPDFHDKVTERVPGNFYVIPSSVNELIVVSDKQTDARGLNAMIREINSTQVSPEERLSDQCLHYDTKTRQFSIGTDHDDKIQQKKVGVNKR